MLLMVMMTLFITWIKDFMNHLQEYKYYTVLSEYTCINEIQKGNTIITNFYQLSCLALKCIGC